MGIKSNFNKFIKSHTTSFNEIHISDFKYKKIAIDTMLFMFKYKSVLGDKWLTGFFNLISFLRRYDVHCVFVFDGVPPIEKKDEQDIRKEKKKQAHHL